MTLQDIFVMLGNERLHTEVLKPELHNVSSYSHAGESDAQYRPVKRRHNMAWCIRYKVTNSREG